MAAETSAIVPGRITPSPATAARDAAAGRRATVVVLGDLGRSPRMVYHALALADLEIEVDLVGYVETELDPAVATHARIRVRPLPVPPREAPRLRVARGMWRFVREGARLLRLLLACLRRDDVLLLQNPPAVPTLAAALVAARLRGARMIVDWHNFGFAMLGLKLGARSAVTRLARTYERALGRLADAHLCVSHAMATELAAHWGIHDAVVLHDHPAERFVPLSPAAGRCLLARLEGPLRWPATAGPAALVVSPTSWTDDEDIAVLVDAALRYDADVASSGDTLPDLVIVVTGDGPQREAWEHRFAELPLRRVHLRTLWLSSEDYPAFLAAADLGVSVHRSASGVDLPMKIADLFGAGVPVCALDYGPCLREMVRDGENGCLFATGAELADQFVALFRGHPDDASLLARLKRNVVSAHTMRWRDAWNATARPLLDRGAPC